MVRIRTGSAWRHDPALRMALRAGVGAERAHAAREIVDALALEVDGVDIAAGLAEGPLLPTLEALLKAVARVVGGAPHATVGFAEGGVELLLRRKGRAVLLSVVALSRPSRLVARDVEVEVDALAAAALDASASLCGELSALLPGAEGREVRPLRAAAHALRRAEAAVPRMAARGAPARATRGPAASPSAPVECVVELEDDDDLLSAYDGASSDLGSLLAPGRIVLRAVDGRELAVLSGLPFLASRDLGRAAGDLLEAVRTGEERCELVLARPTAGPAVSLLVDLAGGTVSGPGGALVPCPPLELARALANAQAEVGRIARERNPRQAENARLLDLERAAATVRAQIDELAEGDRTSEGMGTPGVRASAQPRLPQHPLAPGRLRHLAFREVLRVEAGPPAGAGLHRAGGTVVVTGSRAIAAVAARSGAALWRADGCAFATLAAGLLLVADRLGLRGLSPRTGRPSFSRALPGMTPVAAVGLGRGPLALVERDAVTGLDPQSGRTLWRLEPPGATRLHATGFGGILVVGTDTGILYGIDAGGRVAWRVSAPGPVLGRPVAAFRHCLALCAAASGGAALLAVKPGTGERHWEAPLDVSGPCSVRPWGGRVAVAGAMAGDPIVSAVDRKGAVAWTVAPALAGPATAAAAGALLVVRDGAGALVALGRDGGVRWSRPAPRGLAPPRSTSPLVVRGTVFAAAGDEVLALDVRTGDLLGALPAAAPVRLLADPGMGVVALDADGLATFFRLARHLSVVPGAD